MSDDRQIAVAVLLGTIVGALITPSSGERTAGSLSMSRAASTVASAPAVPAAASIGSPPTATAPAGVAR